MGLPAGVEPLAHFTASVTVAFVTSMCSAAGDEVIRRWNPPAMSSPAWIFSVPCTLEGPIVMVLVTVGWKAVAPPA